MANDLKDSELSVYKACLYKVPAPSPRVFTKGAEAALAPLREVAIHILNGLDDWLILAQSQHLLCAHLVLEHLSQLCLQVS